MGVPGRTRRRTIRFKIFGLLLVPVVSMMALWAVIVGVATRDSLALRTCTTLWTTLRVPADRLAAARYLGGQGGREEMLAQRRHTDRALRNFRRLARDQEAAGTITSVMREDLEDLLDRTARLEAIRGDIDAGLTSVIPAMEAYDAISDAVFLLQRSLSRIEEIPIYQQTRIVINLAYAKELL